MAPKAKFTRAQLQEAALALVDEQGLAALSMRTLAGALGTGPMTLYNYVKDRDELDALVVEAVLAEVRPTSPARRVAGRGTRHRRGDMAHRAPAPQRHPAGPDAAHPARHDAAMGRGPARGAGAQRTAGHRVADRLPHGVGLRHGPGPGAAFRADRRPSRRGARRGAARQPLSAADRDRQGGEGARAGPRVPGRARHRHGGPDGQPIRRSGRPGAPKASSCRRPSPRPA